MGSNFEGGDVGNEQSNESTSSKFDTSDNKESVSLENSSSKRQSEFDVEFETQESIKGFEITDNTSDIKNSFEIDDGNELVEDFDINEQFDESLENGSETHETLDEHGEKVAAISRYMSENNYGREDFEEYSKDPEWRALMKETYPDYELPAISEETARDNLTKYMTENNYGAEDFDEYSKDPKWQAMYEDMYHEKFVPQEITDSTEDDEDEIESTEDIEDEKSFDDKMAEMTNPEMLAEALKAEGELKKEGTGVAVRLKRDQNNWNDVGVETGVIPDGTEKSYEEAFSDIQKAKGSGLEEAVAYTLRDDFENLDDQTKIELEDGTYTKSDLIAMNAKEDMQIGSEYVKAGESIGIELKCGDEKYIASQIDHIDKQLSGYDKFAEEHPDIILHRTLMVTADYERMTDEEKEHLQKVTESHNASISVLPFYSVDMTYAHAMADCENHESDDDAENNPENQGDTEKIDEDAQNKIEDEENSDDMKSEENLEASEGNEDPLSIESSLDFDVPQKEIADKNAHDSFESYRTANATEDIVVYRMCNAYGNPYGNFWTTELPDDPIDAKERLALTNVWQGENGNTIGNQRNLYQKAIIKAGTEMQIGRAAPQKTLGGQELSGGAEQIYLENGMPAECMLVQDHPFGYGDNEAKVENSYTKYYEDSE